MNARLQGADEELVCAITLHYQCKVLAAIRAREIDFVLKTVADRDQTLYVASMSSDPLHPVTSQYAAEPDVEQAMPPDSDIDDIIEACLESLLGHGPVKHPSKLRPMLPSQDVDVEVRQFVLIELIKLDMALSCGAQHAATD